MIRKLLNKFRNTLGTSTHVRHGFAAFLACVFVSVGFTDLAHATNNRIEVVACTNCQTTADFTAAAKTAAAAAVSAGTYIMISTSAGRTAYVSVTGTVTIPCTGTKCSIGSSSKPQLTNIVATPVDVTGASLSGQSEAALESAFGSIDFTIFGVVRAGNNGATPIVLSASADPSGFPNSFVGSSDSAVSAAINPPGSDINLVVALLTVIFPDGSSAQYVQTGPNSWSWNGIAHNSHGDPIDRTGKIIPSPNATATGTGSFNSSSTSSSGATTVFAVNSLAGCYTTTQVMQNGVVFYSGGHYTSC